MQQVIKFTGPEERIKLNFRALPTPMVAWEGTAWEESEPVAGGLDLDSK